MAQGMLAKKMSVATGNLQLYTVSPEALYGTMTLDLDNTAADTDTVDAIVTVYLSNSATPTALDCIGRAVIPAGGHWMISCMLVSPSERFIVVCNKATVACRLTGIEEIPVVTGQ